MRLWQAKYSSLIRFAQLNFATRLIVVPLTTFHRLSEVIGDPQGELIFLFQTGRCGSTLLTQVKHCYWWHILIVPPVKLSTFAPRWFAVAGPTIWNNLPEYLRHPELSIDNFRRQLKTFLFALYWRWHPSALETLVPVRSINLLFSLHY